MFTLTTFDDLKKNPDVFSHYKLCYIDDIPQTIFDYPEGIREKYKDFLALPYEEYMKEYWKHPECRMTNLPNEEYIKGEHELYAYFTPIDLNEQWGDDWNDIPYEHNAEVPYDDIIDETKETEYGLKVVTKKTEYEIIKVPFCIKSYNYKLPCDYGCGNSPFCVRDINRGAVAWIYDFNYKNDKSVSVMAGIDPYEFMNKIYDIEENNPDFKVEDDDY